jgi:hypothetical protein
MLFVETTGMTLMLKFCVGNWDILLVRRQLARNGEPSKRQISSLVFNVRVMRILFKTVSEAM